MVATNAPTGTHSPLEVLQTNAPSTFSVSPHLELATESHGMYTYQTTRLHRTVGASQSRRVRACVCGVRARQPCAETPHCGLPQLRRGPCAATGRHDAGSTARWAQIPATAAAQSLHGRATDAAAAACRRRGIASRTLVVVRLWAWRTTLRDAPLQACSLEVSTARCSVPTAPHSCLWCTPTAATPPKSRHGRRQRHLPPHLAQTAQVPPQVRPRDQARLSRWVRRLLLPLQQAVGPSDRRWRCHRHAAQAAPAVMASAAPAASAAPMEALRPRHCPRQATSAALA